MLAVGAAGVGECRTDSWRHIVAVAAGNVHRAPNTGKSHTLGLTHEGTVLACGWNAHGQCNVTGWTEVVSIAAGWRSSVGLRADGTLVSTSLLTHLRLQEWTGVQQVSCGDWHVVSRLQDGTARAAGNNARGQTDVSTWSELRSVAAGYLHSLGLTQGGAVLAAGDPTYWRGSEQWTDVTAIAAGSTHSVGLTRDRRVVAAGKSEHGQCDVDTWTDVVAIAAGDSHTVGLRADGTVLTTGDNTHGQRDTDSWRLL